MCSKAIAIFESDDRFKIVEQPKEREDIYDKHLKEIEKLERFKALEENKINRKDYIEFLKSCNFITMPQACIPVVKGLGMWGLVKALGRGYEYLVGVMIFTPVAILAWFPMVSDFQTRLLFNQALSQGLQIQRILAGAVKTSKRLLIQMEDES